MTYRKTWFSYVLWVIYTMLCIIFLAFVGNYVCVSYFSELFDQIGSLSLSAYAKDLFGFLIIPAAAILYWIIRGGFEAVRKKRLYPVKIPKMLECVVVLVILSLGIFLRITRVLEYIQLQDGAQSNTQAYVNGMEYFDMAVVKAGASIEPLTYGGAYLYVVLLSAVLSFLGNKIISAIILQVLLQVAGLILVYTVTRKIAGRLPACTALFYFACSESYLEMLNNLGSECLFFVLFMTGMLAMAGFVKYYCMDSAGNVQILTRAASAGILFGILGYLDFTAVVLLFSMIAAIAMCKRKWSRMSVTAVLATVFASVAGWFGICAAISLFRGRGIESEIETWAALHIRNTRTFGFKPIYPYSLDILFFGLMAVLAAFLVFEFFRKESERNDTLWIMLCIVAAPTPMAVFGVQPFGVISMYIWSVLAGLGLQNCMFGGQNKFVKTMIEEINNTVLQTESVEEVQAEEVCGAVEQIPEEKKSKPRYLENPLPLPKKHVRKQMDYQYSIEEKDMRFDLEIEEEDDFDI